ncbi:hypothetical protein [Pseudomonas nitroreducens]|uniref:hypothetical protein n=1 Tax=Pseudomonas nitroreducens TaxID=46680 RepID=UPI002659A6D3|nr:hypothetical protein [Pseudomonas nitroreducens]MCP1651698.1 hypothetical protein [Pseudomonas nitroreducens]MCP1684437.1 hypothetical protein [Pseudomonas nitroreducens]
MNLIPINATHIDFAWQDGAHLLSEACDKSGGEITGDQLKMILSRGERILLRIDEDDSKVGWAVVRVDQLPNRRVLMVTDLYAPGGYFHRCMDEIRAMARSLGCPYLRCAAGPAEARLYQMKCGFEPVYQILEVKV